MILQAAPYFREEVEKCPESMKALPEFAGDTCLGLFEHGGNTSWINHSIRKMMVDSSGK